jgi:hypothetical protein
MKKQFVVTELTYLEDEPEVQVLGIFKTKAAAQKEVIDSMEAGCHLCKDMSENDDLSPEEPEMLTVEVAKKQLKDFDKVTIRAPESSYMGSWLISTVETA